MGTYIRFETDTPEKVNALFAYMNRDNLDGDQIDTGTRVVISQATIMEDIAYINVDPSQVELRHIKTVDDWNKTFPVLAEGCGQIKLSGGDLTATKKAIIDFVVSNQELFTEIVDESGEYIPEREDEFRSWLECRERKSRIRRRKAPWMMGIETDGGVLYNEYGTIANILPDLIGWEENARLIAEAPKLLSTIQQQRDELHHIFALLDKEEPDISTALSALSDALKSMGDAINKATGDEA